MAQAISDYWRWFSTTLNHLREEMVVRHVTDLDTAEAVDRSLWESTTRSRNHLLVSRDPARRFGLRSLGQRHPLGRVPVTFAAI